MITERHTKAGKVYQVRVDIGRDASGKRRYAFATEKTRKAALQTEARLKAEIYSGDYVAPAKQTVGDWLHRWLREHAVHTHGVKQLERARGIVAHHLVPKIGQVKLDRLTPSMVQAAVTAWAEAGYAPRTIRQHIAVLRAAMGTAVTQGVLRRNPTVGLTLPKIEKGEIRALTYEEQRAILDALQGTPAYLPVLVGLTTGLRRGEILGLRWKDVDLDAGMLTIRQTVVETAQGVTVKASPKTSSSRRTILIPRLVSDALKDHRLKQKEQRLLLGPRWQDNDLVFRGPDSGPMRPNYLGLRWRRTVQKLGIDARFHDLRHTHASVLLSQGASLKMVQHRLGHANAALTQGVYSHLMPGDERTAVDKIGTALARE